MRRGSWFGDAQLMPGERVIRTGAARIRIEARPGWWEGRLVLTSDRLCFLPEAEHPDVGTTAVWISDVRHAAPLGKNRLLVSSVDTDLLLELLGVPISPVGLLGPAWRVVDRRDRSRARVSDAVRGDRTTAPRRWMKFAAVTGFVLVALGAGAVLYFVVAQTGGSSGRADALISSPTPPSPSAVVTPVPKLWSDAIDSAHGVESRLIACGDRNNDGVLDAGDGDDLAGVTIPLNANACAAEYGRADLLEAPPTAALTCDGANAPMIIVAAASAGSTLRDSTEGESTGLITIVNALQERATRAGIASQAIVVAPAIFGAEPPQTGMERWVENDLRHRLDALPCLRAVLIGHSHGGVTVTSVTSALDSRYGSRMFGVLIDRTIALYDRDATEMPATTPLLNFYQLNEGWHGVPLALPNVIDIDESAEHAPVALSDGGGGDALVSHKTLDDSPGVEQRIEDAVMGWLAR